MEAPLDELFSRAVEVGEAPTAQKLGPFSTDRVFKLGRLVITSVSLKDDGLKGGDTKDVVLGEVTEFVPDPDVARAMQGLGLPSNFGGDERNQVISM